MTVMQLWAPIRIPMYICIIDGLFHLGHTFYKRITESSYLEGNCIVTSFIPLQLICQVNGKVKVLHHNINHSASDSPRPLHMWAVSEDKGQSIFRFILLLWLEQGLKMI